MNVSRHFAPLTMEAEHRFQGRAILRFLVEIWDCHPEDAVTFMATRRGARWLEHPIKGDRRSAIRAVLEDYPANEWDIYFCPNAFRSNTRKAKNALPTPYAWCDIDEDRPAGFKPRPNVLWETSLDRFQGLWIWKRTLDPLDAEKISKWLLRFGGDTGGWSITKMLRVPGTLNHKPERKGERVRLLRFDTRIKRVPIPRRVLLELGSPTVVANGIDPSGYEAHETRRRYRRAVGLVAGTLMTARQVMRSDRSGAVYLIVSALIEAGANDDEIACILLDNPYFNSKWGSDVDEAERQIVRIRAKLGDDQ